MVSNETVSVLKFGILYVRMYNQILSRLIRLLVVIFCDALHATVRLVFPLRLPNIQTHILSMLQMTLVKWIES